MIRSRYLREWLTIILFALLPFHALLVTLGTKLIAGPGQAPLNVIVIWKEILLLIILIIAAVEIIARAPFRGREDGSAFKIDWIDGCIFMLFVSWFITIILGKPQNIIPGFKYDFVPLIVFFVLRRVQWSPDFLQRVLKAILISGVILALYGFITLLLPPSFFTWLGYSDAHSLYQPDTSLAAFQYIQNTSIRRVQSAMSGPNQLGLYLLIPFSIAISRIKNFDISSLRSVAQSFGRQWFVWMSFLVIGAAIDFTFSRTAWIAATVIVFVSLMQNLRRDVFKKVSIGLGVMGMICAIIIAVAAPSVAFRSGSTKGHIELPVKALQIIIRHPFGLGLGQAGPASNAVSDTCVLLEPGDDPSWAKNSPELCVFVEGAQVQPSAPCNCPLLTENWYLQIGVELGWIGMIAFMGLVVMILRKLGDGRHKTQDIRAVFLAFLGISIAGLLLHSFEDAAVAYSVWMLIAISTTLSKTSQITQ